MFKDDTFGTLAITGLVVGGITYLYGLLGKRQDKHERLEARVAALELSLADIKYLKASQENFAIDVKMLLKEFTDLRVELAAKGEKTHG